MVDIINSVKTGYNQFAPYFSRSRAYNWPDVAQVANSLPQKARVLDVGCGNGRLIDVLPEGTRYTGIDFSSGLLEEARKLHPQAKFIQTDITKKESWEKLGKFDAIFCIAVLHHIPTRKQQLFILKQIKHHLNQDGLAYVTVWNLLQLRFAKAHLLSLSMKLKNPRWLLVPFMNRWQRFCFTFNASYTIALAREAGFKSYSVSYKTTAGETTDFWRGQNLVLEAKA